MPQHHMHERPASAWLHCLGAVALALLIAGLGLAVVAAEAGAAKAPKPAKVIILTGSMKRDTVLLRGITARLTTDRAVKVKLSLGGGLATRSHTVTFRRKGKLLVIFKPTAKARAMFVACGNGKVPVTVSASFLVPRKGSRTKKVTRRIKKIQVVRWVGPTCKSNVVTTVAPRCDPIDPSRCMLPFPNNFFTKPDVTSRTGVRINFDQAAMPADRNGAHIDPTEWNRNDGFSPGQPLVTAIPGLDSQAAFTNSNIVPITDMAQYTRADQPVVVIDAATGQRQMIWAELDSTAGTAANVSLIIRPGRNWLEGHRYIVGLRNLRNAGGGAIPATAGFRQYRDNAIPATASALIKGRRPAMEDIFARLSAAGVSRSSLNLAWDFTVASAGSVAGRMLAIRDDAFRKIGDPDLTDGQAAAAPPFTATATDTPADPKIARTVTGTFTMPCYLTSPGCAPGGVFHYTPGDTAPDRTPTQNGTFTASYTCRIPRQTLGGAMVTASRGVVYGHGLLGGQAEVGQDAITDMTFGQKVTYCATDWYGMAAADIDTVSGILGNLSKLPQLPDRIQQGMLASLFLGRLLASPNGFAGNAAFQDAAATPVLAADNRSYFDGNSQGAIIGGAVMAISPDAARGTLSVPGMNYSTLLQRSIDFSPFATTLNANYPDTLDRQISLGLIQMLWDRGEADGYAAHIMNDAYENTPSHHVLLQAAFGDHQVANVAALTEARTIGAQVYTPDGVANDALDSHRWDPVADPFFGIAPVASFPYDGSALVMFDSGPLRNGGLSGTNPAPLTNQPPSAADGNDPHGLPRATATAQAMKGAFFKPGGLVESSCSASPSGRCYTAGFTGLP